MVHWSEEKDGYRLRITRRGVSVIWAAAALFPLYLWAPMVESIQRFHIEVLPLQDLVGYVLFGTIECFCLWRVVANWRTLAWIEVSMRGGLARWGEVGQPPMQCAIPVDRFEGNDLLGGLGWNVVVLVDGVRRVPLLGGWVAPRTKVQRIVERLNQLLGVEATK